LEIPFYHVDTFTREAFGGNPAAVCVLERWLDDRALLAVAAEINLPATAFFTGDEPDLRLRWFNGSGELELCGHATLATGYVLLNDPATKRERAAFETRAGRLEAARIGERLEIDACTQPLPDEEALMWAKEWVTLL